MLSPRESELIGIAQDTKGFMPDDEGLALMELARRTGSERAGAVLLEIGSWCGKSAVYLGAGAEATRATLFSVDHHHGSEENQVGWEYFDETLVDPNDGRLNTLPHFQRTIAVAQLEDSVIGIVGESSSVARHWSTPRDLLFIDGGHGPALAHADYRVWTPKVAAGGYLAIHDVFEDPGEGGRPPYEIYQAALSSGYFTDFDRCGSLAILRRRS
jgi:predicted O-methyltransferase YrrM